MNFENPNLKNLLRVFKERNKERWVTDLISDTLVSPISSMIRRRGKRFRAEMVEIGFLLSEQTSNATIGKCLEISDLIEAVHMGSMIIDDIEDESSHRRGDSALHVRYGLPVALNAGNFLYFWPMDRLKDMELEHKTELAFYRLFNETLLRAHYGQAIDVGVPIDTLPKERIYPVCLSTLELKTGALMALAVQMGAILGGSSRRRLRALDRFGHRFGVALQMFDDIGNLVAANAKSQIGKRYEDLRLKRASYVWASASLMDDQKFEVFKKVVRELPDAKPLQRWMKSTDFIDRAKKSARVYLKETNRELQKALGGGRGLEEAYSRIKKISERLSESYG